MNLTKKRMLRLFAVMLSIVLTLATVSACATNAPAATGTPGQKSAEPTTQASAAAPDVTIPPVKTLSLLCCDFRVNFDAHPLSGRNDYPAYQKFAEDLAKLGVALEFETVVPDQLELTLQTRLASGGDLPDILAAQDKIDDATAVRYGKDGIVLDVLNACKQYDKDNSIMTFWDKYFPGARGMVAAENGAIYWFPYLYTTTIIDDPSFEYGGTGAGASIRKDWIDALGLTYKNVLTPDELYTMLETFRTKDANGNGAADETLGIGLNGFNNGIAQGFGLPTDLARVVSGQDKIQCPWYGAHVKDYITFMKRLVTGGIYDTAVMGSGVADQMLAENKIGLTHNYFGQTWLEPQVTGVTAEYAPILLDTGFTDIKPVLYRGSKLGVWGKWFITSGCKDVDAAIQLFKYIYTYDYYVLSQFGIKDVTFTEEASGLKKAKYDFGTAMKDSANKNVALDFLLGQNALPDLGLNEYTKDAIINGTKFEAKNQMEAFIQTYDCNNDYMVQTLALATDAENEIVNKYETVLKTYSEELLTDLILGNKNLDDLGTYVTEMKGLGLDEYIAVFQARYDRFIAAKQ